MFYKSFYILKQLLVVMENHEVAKILENIADILELQNIPWKPAAYRKAAQSVEMLSEDINLINKRNELKTISGIGENIAEKIKELLETGQLAYYEKLKKKFKIDIESLKNIPELGPKRIKLLYDKLKIRNLEELELAIKKQKIRTLAGFGEKLELSLLEGIKVLKTARRFSFQEVKPIVLKIIKMFKILPFVEKIDAAGSFRRKAATVGDLDFLIVSNSPELVMNTFTKQPDVFIVLDKGKTKASVRLKNGLQIDLRVVDINQYGAALLYFTGSKQHNIELRKLALKKGWTLNEYALSDLKNKGIIASKTEEEIYDKLGLKFIPPEERNGELEKYRK